MPVKARWRRGHGSGKWCERGENGRSLKGAAHCRCRKPLLLPLLHCLLLLLLPLLQALSAARQHNINRRWQGLRWQGHAQHTRIPHAGAL